MRENRPSGSMSGEWKRGTARLLRHRRPKGPETDRLSLHHRATPRLYHLRSDYFHHPTLRQELEPLLLVAPLDDRQLPPTSRPHPVDQPPLLIDPIGPDHLEP